MDQTAIGRIRRHDLLEINDRGRQQAFDSVCVASTGLDREQARKIIVGEPGWPKIPGIARREEDGTVSNLIPVGFASAWRVDGNRIRIPAFVQIEWITRIVSPQQVMQLGLVPRTPCLKALQEIGRLAEEWKLEMGVWGSAALEVFTGLHYTDDNSDLDLLLESVSMEVMQAFWERMQKVGQKHQCNIDVEISLPTGYGVKLVEVLSNSGLVLGKGLQDVVLIEKETIIQMLSPR